MVSILGTLKPVSPRPEADAGLQPAQADVLEPTGGRHVPDLRLDALLRAAAQTFVRAELGGVERRHGVEAVAKAAAECAVHAGAHVEPRRRHDDRIDERPLDAVKRRRLVPLVDDADGHEHHARAEVQGRVDEEVDVRLLELQLAGLFQPFHDRVLELELADESQRDPRSGARTAGRSGESRESPARRWWAR